MSEITDSLNRSMETLDAVERLGQKRPSELAASAGSGDFDDGTMKLRVALYNAACAYAEEVSKELGNWDKISAAADKLESAADAFSNGSLPNDEISNAGPSDGATDASL